MSSDTQRPHLVAARAYVYDRLTSELPAHLGYHRAAHTADDVVPALVRLARAEGVDGADLVMVETAGWFHDLGFVVRAEGHEEIGIGIAASVLPTFGYDATAIDRIAMLVRATKLPQQPFDHHAAVLADADLDVLGRADFFDRNDALRAELAAQGHEFSDARWYADQVTFVATHRYFTAAARDANDAGKAENLTELQTRAFSAATSEPARSTEP